MLQQILLYLLFKFYLGGHPIARSSSWTIFMEKFEAWRCEMQITVVFTFGITIALWVFLFDVNLFNTVFASSDSSLMSILWNTHKILWTIIANGDSATTTVMLPVKKIEGMLTYKASLHFAWGPNRSLADFQKLDPQSESFLTKLHLILFLLYINWHVKLACLLPILAGWVLYLNLKAKVGVLNFD